MNNDNQAEMPVQDNTYFMHVGMTIPVGVVLWIVDGTIAGYEVFAIHEWGMYWLIAVPFVVPVVIVISMVLAAARDLAIQVGLNLK